MNAISTFFDRLLFGVTCFVGWVIFPALIVGGAVTLFCYALIARASPAAREEPVVRAPSSRLFGPLHP